jgi:transposase
MKMSQTQWKRLDVVRRVERGELTVVAAAALLRLSERQVRKLRARVRTRGARGVVHGNTGRRPRHALKKKTRRRIVELRRTKYRGDINDQHFTEKLEHEEGLRVSRATVQRVLRAAGIGAVHRRRPPRHHRRRERMPCEGMLVQWDGSPHDWLQGRGPLLTLMGAVDDATGDLLPGAHFILQECTAGYLRLLREMARTKGLPLAVYQDRHSALCRNDEHMTLAEELRGEQDPTQVGRALAALGITAIFALSPQAKGRVERRWGYLQDRLVTELRLAGACTLEEANRVLDRVRPELNRRVTRAPRESTPAWRPVPPGLDLDRVCSLHYEATVQNDNTVKVNGVVIDIPPGPGGRGYPKARVEVDQLLDGSFRVYWRDTLLGTAPAPAGPLRARRRRRRATRVSRDFEQAIERLAAATS